MPYSQSRTSCEIIHDPDYVKQPGVSPAGPVEVDLSHPDPASVVNAFLRNRWRDIVREPRGELTRPFLVPGSVYEQLWDWDAFFIACGLPDEGLEYGRGSILNLLDGVREDGRPPKMGKPDGTYIYTPSPIPVHAQFVYLMAKRMHDFSWAEGAWKDLVAIRHWYERECRRRGNYFVWPTFRGNGIDNNPAVYGRPAWTSAGIDLAVWHCREYHALASLAGALNRNDSALYREKALAQSDLIRTRYWDRVDAFFYAVDCSVSEEQTSIQKVTWETYLKFRNWVSIFPLWADAADAEQTEAVITRFLDGEEFWSPNGIRSLSALDPLYNNVPMGNPSNWQGPVWGLSTLLTAYVLRRCGYEDQARETTRRLLCTMAGDIEQNGTIHEYYHGHTGQPVMKPDFLSWNLLALGILDHLEAGRDPTTLDLVVCE